MYRTRLPPTVISFCSPPPRHYCGSVMKRLRPFLKFFLSTFLFYFLLNPVPLPVAVTTCRAEPPPLPHRAATFPPHDARNDSESTASFHSQRRASCGMCSNDIKADGCQAFISRLPAFLKHAAICRHAFLQHSRPHLCGAARVHVHARMRSAFDQCHDQSQELHFP